MVDFDLHMEVLTAKKIVTVQLTKSAVNNECEREKVDTKRIIPTIKSFFKFNIAPPNQ